jgi:hypothetical protein
VSSTCTSYIGEFVNVNGFSLKQQSLAQQME